MVQSCVSKVYTSTRCTGVHQIVQFMNCLKKIKYNIISVMDLDSDNHLLTDRHFDLLQFSMF